ncbi:hypothetical protein [Brumicola nitratireducens]|uniref:Uncharacterized protein n=1 Tax=Glaciecola nitratireducens (strain JCM 12485 / KCTC 12276 / FR1064) TaxID=1085623 RepID=G4QFN7_GLANF|nr:hypothetical protein [Glaciecola nitratireducens]AEP28822.1 hypothetical protein GNIT_0678 [Glaciecola nitratireducens FR1064]
MSTRKKVTLAAVLVGLTLFSSLTWYNVKYSMEFVPSFTIKSENSIYNLLIATQGSAYKRSLVDGVIEQLKNRPFNITVIDVSALADVNTEEWTAIVILHTWESWRPQQDAMSFVHRNPDADNTIVLSTSGQGDLKIKGIDAITSASNMADVDKDVAKIMRRIDLLVPNG